MALAARGLKSRSMRHAVAPTLASGESGAGAPAVSFSPFGLSLYSESIFSHGGDETLREFLLRVFALDEIDSVTVRRDAARAELKLRGSNSGVRLWRKLGGLLRGASAPDAALRDRILRQVSALQLHDVAPDAAIRVGRVGDTLTTWRARQHGADRMRLWHPALRQRRDVLHRLRLELAALHGVAAHSTNPVTGAVTVRFDPTLIDGERLVGVLEKAWPRLLDGLIEPPPSPRKLIAAGGLLTLAATAQFFRPALRPVAVLGVALYGLPNVIAAARQLSRGQIGLPLLYSTGMAFMLLSGMPFSSTVMAIFMQSWPRLSRRALQRVDRELFGNSRRRFVWARLRQGDGAEIQVDLDQLVEGDIIHLRSGDYAPVDGVVVDGFAAVDEDMLTGVIGAIDKSAGDRIYASTFVRAGSVTLRVLRDGGRSATNAIAEELPHGFVAHLPSSAEAERIANRNAKPALALAAFSLLTTRTPRLSQAIIRPDYATAPRLSAQLSTVIGIGEALRQGAFFRSPAALDRLLGANVYVFDDSASLDRGRIATASICVAGDRPPEDVLTLATAAFAKRGDARASALRLESARRKIDLPHLSRRRRVAGAIRFEDDDGRLIEVATTAYVDRAALVVPDDLASALAEADVSLDPAQDPRDPDLRPLWVARDGRILGVVSFERLEPALRAAIEALRTRNPKARFLHLSERPQDVAQFVATRAGIETAIGGLDAAAKARTIRDLSRRAIWIGNGAAAASQPSITASAVSISIGGAPTLLDDTADIVLMQEDASGILTIRQLAQAHLGRLRADFRTVYAANLFGAAGGFLFGFGSLRAGLSSNFGTALIFAARWNDLKCLARASERRDLARLSAPTEELEYEHGGGLIPRPGAKEDVLIDFPDLIDAPTTIDGV